MLSRPKRTQIIYDTVPTVLTHFGSKKVHIDETYEATANKNSQTIHSMKHFRCIQVKKKLFSADHPFLIWQRLDFYCYMNEKMFQDCIRLYWDGSISIIHYVLKSVTDNKVRRTITTTQAHIYKIKYVVRHKYNSEQKNYYCMSLL